MHMLTGIQVHAHVQYLAILYTMYATYCICYMTCFTSVHKLMIFSQPIRLCICDRILSQMHNLIGYPTKRDEIEIEEEVAGFSFQTRVWLKQCAVS